MNSEDYNEPELIADACAGSQTALNVILKRYRPRLYKLTWSVLHHREDAEDAVQDCLMRAFSHLTEFRGDCSLSTWLSRIAINCALMQLRRRKLRNHLSLETSLDGERRYAELLASGDPSPEADCLLEEKDRLTHKLLNRLPNLFREITLDRITKQLSIRDLAGAYGISESAAKSRLSRGRTMLQQQVVVANSAAGSMRQPATVASGLQR